MRCVVLNQRYPPDNLVSPGNSSWSLPSAVPPAMNFTLGTEGGVMRTGVDSDVETVKQAFVLQSERSP